MSLEAGPTDMAHLRYFRGDTTFGPFEMLRQCLLGNLCDDTELVTRRPIHEIQMI